MAMGIVKGLTGTSFVPPVGFVWKSASSTSPASIYAGTAWSQIKDRAILAAGGSYSNGSTGGATTHTLSTAEMPSHGHSGSTSSNGEHSHTSITAKSTKAGYEWDGDSMMNYSLANRGSTGILTTNTSTSTNGAHSHSATINATGGGKAFSILNPYIVRYMWERIG